MSISASNWSSTSFYWQSSGHSSVRLRLPLAILYLTVEAGMNVRGELPRLHTSHLDTLRELHNLGALTIDRCRVRRTCVAHMRTQPTSRPCFFR